jgi:hypothetical protein
VVGVHLAVSLASAWATHQGYRTYTGWVTSREPAYQYADGLFLIAAVAPALVEADAASPAVARAMDRTDLRDLKARNYQRWGKDGLVARVHAEVGDWGVTNALCRETALNAFRRDPLAALAPALQTYRLYWDEGYMRWIVTASDQQHGFPLSDTFLRALHARFGYRGTREQNREPRSLTQTMQIAANAPWRYAGLLSPCLAILALWRSRAAARPAAVLVAVVTVMLAVATMTGITEPLNRYLHPLSWLGLLSAAVVFDSLGPRRSLTLRDGT